MSVKKQEPWRPNKSHIAGVPLSSQEIAMYYSQNDENKIDFMVIDGGRGTGKTDLVIAIFMYQVGQGYGENLIGMVLRDQASTLDSIFERAITMAESMFRKKEFKVLRSSETMKIVWNSGEILMFRHLSSHKEFDTKFKGTQITMLIIEELTNWEDQELIEKMKSIVRMPEAANGKKPPLMIRATTNPDGPGHQSVKEMYITDHKSCVKWTEDEPHPYEKGKIISYSYMRIRTNYQENKNDQGVLRLGDDYLASYNKLKKINYRQWLMWVMGVWDVPESGTIFEDVLDKESQSFSSIEFSGNAIYRAFDWGSSDPYCMLYYLKGVEGEVYKIDGQYVQLDADTFIIIDEVHNVENMEKPNVGTKHSNSTIIKRLKEKEAQLKIQYRAGIYAGPSDDFINRGNGSGRTPYDDYKDAGIRLTRGIKKAGSIEAGISLISERLYATKNKEAGSKKLFISKKCKYLWHMLERLMPEKDNPLRPRPKQADHPIDPLRYIHLEKAGKFEQSEL